MRIAIGQLWQESNTFNPIPTTPVDFEQFGVSRGEEMVEQMASTNELGGFIQALGAWPERPEIVGLVRLPAWPGGQATAETFHWLRNEMIGALERALPVDAVLLALHGSLVSEAEADVEGAILQALRQRIGPHVPLVATLDLHANITRLMVEHADAVVLYHTAPHIDVYETGARGARVLRRIIAGARPVTGFVKIPMVVPAERANTQDPASVSFGFRKRLQALELEPGILSAGLATVQPWLDIPNLGAAVVVVTDGDAERARAESVRLATEVWSHRREYLPELVPVEDAVREAFRENEGLVVLGDSADSTTSGAPGDSNHVLRELLKYDWPRPALVTLVDADLVIEARRRGIGAELAAQVGGKRDVRYSRPMPLTATAAALFDARFVLSGHLARNMPIDMGPSAVLRHGNVHIIVTSRSGPHFAPELFQAAGIDPFAASILIAKSPCGFRAAYTGRARKIQVVRAPGCAPADFWRYEYRNISRPLWPWDEIDHWTPMPIVWASRRVIP
jgi:microcystin degradation protein MlrC